MTDSLQGGRSTLPPFPPSDNERGWKPASTPQELEDISTSRTGLLNLGPVQQPLDFLTKKTNELNDATGLRLAIAYIMPFMHIPSRASPVGTNSSLLHLAVGTKS
jgi:hypothetical protein